MEKNAALAAATTTPHQVRRKEGDARQPGIGHDPEALGGWLFTCMGCRRRPQGVPYVRSFRMMCSKTNSGSVSLHTSEATLCALLHCPRPLCEGHEPLWPAVLDLQRSAPNHKD
ncbi:unnamed protein product, partial [Pylaiella littoralis]